MRLPPLETPFGSNELGLRSIHWCLRLLQQHIQSSVLAVYLIFRSVRCSCANDLSTGTAANSLSLLDFINAAGTGYLQPKFVCYCPSCNVHINKESLSLFKFVCDMIHDPDDSEDAKQYGEGVYFA